MHKEDEINANDCYATLWNYSLILNALDDAK
jgi:hypothetical protein